MIDFNDACRYQNYLRELLSEVFMYLREDSFVTTTVRTHHKSDANKDVADEVETVQGIFDDPEITPDKMVGLALDIIDERNKLAVAIAGAKARANLQIDAACMTNKDKKDLVTNLNRLANMKTREIEGIGTGYAMNEIDGKQAQFVYKLTTLKKINFDRNDVKGIAGRLIREMKETSKEIDRYNLDTQVDFAPRWSEEDSLEDILSAR